MQDIEKNAQNNLEIVLNGVFDFINGHSSYLNPCYKVFKEQFVVCWAGEPHKIDENSLLF